MPDESDTEARAPAPSPHAAPPTVPEQVAARHLEAGHHHGHAQLPRIQFIEEIKRRNVGRVAILYIVVSYVVLEVFEMFYHLLEMPPWTGRAAVLLAVLGFPIALLVAWAYEITPEGLKPTDEVPPQKSIATQTGQRLDRAIIAVLAIGLTYFVADKFWLSKRAAPVKAADAFIQTAATTVDHSIAVLPFVDMSANKDQEYFADGMAEELLDLLSRVPELRVISRTSSFSFKGKNDDIRTIGAKLGVATLLEGSVRTSANILRVTAQLIRATDGSHIWSTTYDRKSGDIFKVQDDIAAAVVQSLKVSLLPDAMPKAAGTDNVEAHSLMLQGLAILRNVSSREDMVRADNYLQRSLELDPDNARAWAFLASLRFEQANRGWLPEGWDDARGWQEAHAAAQRSIALEPNSQYGHSAFANILFFHDWNWPAAEAQIQLALAASPNDVTTNSWSGFKYWIYGDVNSAIPILRRTMELDPLSVEGWVQVATLYTVAGNFNEAQSALRRASDLNPNGLGVHEGESDILLAMGNPEAALIENDKTVDLQAKQFGQAVLYFKLGRKHDADMALGKYVRDFSSSDALGIAEIYASRGAKDDAFLWLDRAYQRHEVNVAFVKTDSDLVNLREDARFKALLRKMNLPL
jgi:adenylate cyclase